MVPTPTLHIFPTIDAEGDYWAERLSTAEAPDAALLVRQNERAAVLMTLLRHWEESQDERVDFWAGTLWDIPVIRHFLKAIRIQSQKDVSHAIEQFEVPKSQKNYAKRDREALRCLREMTEPSEQILSNEAWRELMDVCRTTALEFGTLPWDLSVISEQDIAPDANHSVWIPFFLQKRNSTWPAWLRERNNVEATAAQSDDRGATQFPDYHTAREFAWKVSEQKTRIDAKISPSREEAQTICLKKSGQLAQWQQHLNKHIFSVTELETYKRSPYWYYCERVLKLEPLEGVSWDLEPSEIGILVHKILEAFYRQELDINELDELATREMKVLQQEQPELDNLLATRHLNKIKRAVRNLIIKDQQDMAAQKKPLRPTYFEWRFGDGETAPFTIEGHDGQPIRLRGTVDRIDVDPVNKTFLVIDYKTGSRKITGADIERGDSLQLPLYIKAVQQLLLPDHTLIGGVFYSLADISKRDGMIHIEHVRDYFDVSLRSSSFMSPDKWSDVLEQSIREVREIVEELYRGEFAVCEDLCAYYCPYQDICRWRETVNS